MWTIALDTLRALLEPTRIVAASAVVVPLLYAQAIYSAGSADGVIVGLSLSFASIFVAPVAYRLLARGLLGYLGYLAAGACSVLLFGIVLPGWFHFEDRFLTLPETLPLLLGLWLAAGWGLGRDVAAESALLAAAGRERELMLAKDHAELLAIRAHLDPHFLFNTLNALAEWCAQDPAIAEAGILKLASVLRAVLGAVSRPTWPLSDEIALCEEVLSLHRTRDPERFAFSVEDRRPPGDSTEVPTLILLPVVENAVKYGPARGHRGNVRLIVEQTEDGTRVTVSNPGPFLGERQGGRGLSMVRTRLSQGERLEIVSDGDRTTLALHLLDARRSRR